MKEDRKNKYSQHEFLKSVVLCDGIESIEDVVQMLFFALSFKSKLSGTVYLKEAIRYWYTLPAAKRVVMTTDIYPPVATKLYSTPDRVERAIRNAIIDCYRNGNLMLFNDLVQSDVISPKYAPTNGEFLSSVVSWLRVQSRERFRQMSFLQYIEA